MIDLALLGRVEIAVDGRPSRGLGASPKRLGLLVYLHLARPQGPRQRAALVGVFWPDQDEHHARQALNQSLYFLRKELGPETIRSSGRELVEAAPGQLRSDVADFDAAVDAGEMERALALYRGELLPGFYLSGSIEFERWLEAERSRLRDRTRSVVATLIGRAIEQGDREAALHWAQRARLMAPLDHAFLGTQLELLARCGRVEEIQREFRTYEAHLRDDLEMEPTRELLEQFEAALRAAQSRPVPGPQLAPTRDARGSPPPQEAVAPTHSGPARRPRRLAGALAMAALGLAAVWYALGWVSDASGAVGYDRRLVLVSPVAHTGDTALAAIARHATAAVAHELSLSGLVRVVIGDSGSDAPSRSAAARDAGLVVRGAVHASPAGGDRQSALLEAVVVESATGQVVGRVRPTTVLLAAPERGLAQFRDRVAGAAVMAADFELGAWTATSSPPPDLDSYRLFAAGLDAFHSGDLTAADSLFLAAATHDSHFVTPLVWAVRARSEAHNHAAADSLARRLEPLRARLSGADAAMYDYYVAYLRGPWEDAYLAAKRMVEIVPTADWQRLLASAALAANRPREAMAVLDRVEREGGPWIRDWPLRWRTWTMALHAVGESSDQLELARQWADRDARWARRAELAALAALGRVVELEAVLDERMRSDTVGRVALMLDTAAELLAHGHPAMADRLAARAIDLAEAGTGWADTAVDARFARASILLDAGRYEDADRLLRDIDQVPGRPAYLLWAFRGLSAAGAGREAEARAYADTLLANEYPLDAGTYTMKAARILAALGDRRGATELFRRAIEDGHGFYYWLHTVREFHSLSDHPRFRELVRPRG